ncbi:hypothetical protein Zmor_024396 [Zophobas morio]|uniref:Uncharacterized protein n=1 Tax=Zophobas morio TaxID=2755281 RepID=A0AA38I261_9CUCU|nr:hypothetical protein Zmor_024396 [Zophobas morio]
MPRSRSRDGYSRKTSITKPLEGEYRFLIAPPTPKPRTATSRAKSVDIPSSPPTATGRTLENPHFFKYQYAATGPTWGSGLNVGAKAPIPRASRDVRMDVGGRLRVPLVCFTSATKLSFSVLTNACVSAYRVTFLLTDTHVITKLINITLLLEENSRH